VLFEAWPAEPRLLERLLGSPSRSEPRGLETGPPT